MSTKDAKRALANAVEAITRILAACDWGGDDEETRGEGPMLHLNEAANALHFLVDRVRRGQERPLASDVHALVDQYYQEQARESLAEHGFWYWTCVVPWAPEELRTQWHPLACDRHGPFSTLTRGAFPSPEAAMQWGRDHLGGMPYSVKRCMGVKPADE